MKETMKAGTYYVGDLCYVMNSQWDEFCSLTIKGNECLDGVFKLKNGIKFCTYGTAYGDGCYEDQFGNSYPVDAGLIGCIRVKDIKDKNANTDNGAIIDFDEDFTCSDDNGILYFGHVCIDTKCEDTYEDEED